MKKKYVKKARVPKKAIAVEKMKERILDRLFQSLNEGSFDAPWDSSLSKDDIFYAYDTGKIYSLTNSLMLREPGAYLTFDQYKKLQKKYPDLKMKKGSTSDKIYFFSRDKKEIVKKDSNGKTLRDKDGNPLKEEEYYSFLKEASVFHESCFENLPEKESKEEDILMIPREEILELLDIKTIVHPIDEDVSYDPLNNSLILSDLDASDYAIYHNVLHLVDKTFKGKDIPFSFENLKADIFASLFLKLTKSDEKIPSSEEYLVKYKEEIESGKICIYSAIYEANRKFDEVKELLFEKVKEAA